jgi:hypothetical protein
MITVQKKAFDNALKLLTQMNCQFLIIDEDGNEYGQLDKKGKRKRAQKYPYGALANHVRTYINDLEVGQIQLVPFDMFKPNDLQSSASAFADKIWGKGSYHSHVNKTGEVLEFVRIS